MKGIEMMLHGTMPRLTICLTQSRSSIRLVYGHLQTVSYPPGRYANRPSKHAIRQLNNAAQGWEMCAYRVRSRTMKSGVVPEASIAVRECDVHTASVLHPALRPAARPEGASSTTRPANKSPVSKDIANCESRRVHLDGSTPNLRAPARYGSG